MREKVVVAPPTLKSVREGLQPAFHRGFSAIEVMDLKGVVGMHLLM